MTHRLQSCSKVHIMGMKGSVPQDHQKISPSQPRTQELLAKIFQERLPLPALTLSHHHPFQISCINGTFCTIFRLSYPKSGNSINSYIDKDNFSFQYVTIDRVIQARLPYGQSRYRNRIPVNARYIRMTGAIGDAMKGKILFR